MEEKEQKQEMVRISEKDRESIRIQKTEWIYDQIQRQRAAEDALFAQMEQEQRVLDTLSQSIDNNMERTKETRKYNQEFREQMDSQVYAMYGLTEDKLQGMREYKNAYYQGCAFSLFFLSAVLTVFCGVLHGFQSQITLFMLAFSGIEGALLTQEKKRGRLLELCCKVLYLLMFPLMMVIFVCYELEYPEYDMLLPAFSVYGLCVLIIAAAAYFLYNPYRKEKKKVGEAKDTIREIEKTAKREVRKNQKSREKYEKKMLKQQEKEELRQRRLQDKSDKKQLRTEKRKALFARIKKQEKSPAEEIEENKEPEEIGEEQELEEILERLEAEEAEERQEPEKIRERLEAEEAEEKQEPEETAKI